MLGSSSLSNLGRVCEKRRREKGWTQADMVARANVNRTTISKIENGHFTGSIKILISYLTALGLQLDVTTGTLPIFGEQREEDDDE